MEQSFDVKAVLFDLGRVLIGVDFNRGVFGHLLGGQADHDFALLEKLFKDDLFIRFSSGQIPPQDFHRAMCNRLKLSYSYDEFVEEWCAVFYPINGMEAIFFEAMEKYAIGIISDTDPLHWAEIRKLLPFLKKVEQPVLSFEQGVMKPHPDMYRVAAKNLNLPIHNCLFIDDRLINVEGAKRAGMQAVQFVSDRQLRTHLKNRNIL